MTRVAVVLVTSNSERWLEQTLASIKAQTRPADDIVVIDDRSTDRTREILSDVLGSRAHVLASRETSTDRSTRIAGNFRQGVQAARACDVAVLGDHDDVWQPDRIAHQVELMQVWSDITMLASDGSLIDGAGRPIAGSLRTAFPVPQGFNDLAPAEQMRAVIRRSIATGGASAVRPSAFADLPIPEGWLHDRWWSLMATAEETMRLDDRRVIDYRVSETQEVGLDRGHQGRSGLSRLRSGVGSLGNTGRRLRDLQGLTTQATAQTAPELTGPRLLRNLL